MVSNALERSKNIPAVISLLLDAFTILSTSLITAIFVECLGRKPNWFPKGMLCLFKTEIHLLKTVFQVFQKIQARLKLAYN